MPEPPRDGSHFDSLADLLDVLDLVPADQIDPTLTGAAGAPVVNSLGDRDDVFYGRSQPMASGRVFGGQVVAQAVIAAGRTVGPGARAALDDERPRVLHSLHGFFLRPGDADEPIQFAVQRLHDGRSFSSRRVHAIQHGNAILSMIFSFQVPAPGLEHQSVMPQVPDPDDLPSLADILAAAPNSDANRFHTRRPMDLRHCEGPLYDAPASPRESQHVWVRTVGPLPDDPLLHQALLAYASDYTILEVALRTHGIAWFDKRLRAASLDHSMWFHRPARMDEWILYAERSPSASGGRGLGLGHMFARSGVHVATVAQEGMIRLVD